MDVEYKSSHAQGCEDVGNQLGYQRLVSKLCNAKNDVRMHYCHACMSFFGSTRDAKEGLRRDGFSWKLTIRGFVTKARIETTRWINHSKTTRRDRFHCVLERYYYDETYRNNMLSNGIDYDTMQEWDRMYLERENKPRPIQGVPCENRRRKCARWESIPTIIGGRDAKPHSWNHKATDPDDDAYETDDVPKDETIQDEWGWSESWSKWTFADSAGGDPSYAKSTWYGSSWGASSSSWSEWLWRDDATFALSGARTPTRLSKGVSVRGVRTHFAGGCVAIAMCACHA